MTRQLKSPMPPEIEAAQRAASDPASSVWVSANAGSGKTYVLTARVLRLLLSGVPPEQILCLTYTKAAAAEMRSRVSARLGRWALMDDEQLGTDLTVLTGMPPTAGERLRARALFAHALDTPGGLKIQTIHAFCEAVLHRFPKEAGVPFDFTVLEDFERDAMLLEAREQVIAAGLRGGAQALAVQTLFTMLSDFSIETAIAEALAKPAVLKRVLARRAEAMVALDGLAGSPGSVDDVLDQISSGYLLTQADHARLFALVRPDPAGDSFADRLARIDPAHPDARLLMETFLTQTERTARKTLLKKATALLLPEIAARCEAEAARLETMVHRLKAAELVDRSAALLEIIAAIVARFEAAKAARSLLDFDDLVERMALLLADEAEGAWVRYKLDSDISHILVDEGQDTNPRQWAVIRALVAEFFYGKSAVERPRTLFAVGDQKQSIFSFQGADPNAFVTLERQLVFTAKAVAFEFSKVPLRISFRTLPNVLAAVDLVFAREDLGDAVLEAGMVHGTARAEGGGLVTLWPPLRELEDDTDPDAWATAAPPAQTQSAARRVAERIAREIKGWLDAKRPLGPRGRPVAADDVLVLVQVRSVLFHEVIRALTQAGIPTPGADRLPVTTHIAALDLMALGDVLCNSADDLQLAALLRSPLFDISEADLEAVAHGRPDRTPLWSALRVSTIPSIQAAFRQLHAWRARLDLDRPFDFYAMVLYQAGGLKKFRARMGGEVDDVFAEFLELALQHEQSAQPSLLGFLAELRAREVTIKRELAEAGSGVRVMTVHGAKGLEAPIVILADAATTEIGRDRRAIFMLPDIPLFFHAASKDAHTAQTMLHRQDAERAQKDEYWRKLYVAMTRAEDELYVTGYLTRQGKIEGSWYEAIEQGLRPQAQSLTDSSGAEVALIYPRERAADAVKPAQMALDFSGPPTLTLPELPPHRLRRVVRPSLAFSGKEPPPERVLETTVERLEPRDPDQARREGIALHALLQHLLKVPPEERPGVAAKALAVLVPDLPDRQAAIAARAMSILSRPELGQLFGPNSRGEVPILAQGFRKGAPVTVAGRIDRIVVEPHRVLIIDYKSDAQAPRAPTGVPAAYASQLGLYALVAGQLFPGRQVEAGILWTELESFMNLPQSRLREAVAEFTLR